MRFLRLCLLTGVSSFAMSTAIAQGVAQDSPFQGTPSTTASPVARERYELVGISVIGAKTSICLFDTEKATNRWLKVGEKSGGLEVVSCDTKADKAVIKLDGQTKTLALRKASVAAAVPSLPIAATEAVAAPTPPPAEAPPPGPMTEQQIQEREARMLVSDLLEIGMQQRKAYEEKKAAEDAKKAAVPSPTPAQK